MPVAPRGAGPLSRARLPPPPGPPTATLARRRSLGRRAALGRAHGASRVQAVTVLGAGGSADNRLVSTRGGVLPLQAAEAWVPAGHATATLHSPHPAPPEQELGRGGHSHAPGPTAQCAAHAKTSNNVAVPGHPYVCRVPSAHKAVSSPSPGVPRTPALRQSCCQPSRLLAPVPGHQPQPLSLNSHGIAKSSLFRLPQ